MQQATNFISSSTNEDRPDVVILHILTNDLKTQEPEECRNNLEQLVHCVGQKWPGAKCLVSLATPRADDLQYHTKATIINALIKQKLSGVPNLFLVDHSNMIYNGNANSRLLKNDNYHLNEKDISLLANNIKRGIHNALNIPLLRSRSRPRGRNGNQHNSQRGRGRDLMGIQ